MKFKEFIPIGETVKTLAIITAHNPHGTICSKRLNDEYNRRLFSDIQLLGCPCDLYQEGLWKGKKEEAFLVANVSKQELMQLAGKYNQDAVVYGYYNKPNFEFEYIENNKIKERKSYQPYFKTVTDVFTMFNEIKSGNFSLPLFDIPPPEVVSSFNPQEPINWEDD